MKDDGTNDNYCTVCFVVGCTVNDLAFLVSGVPDPPTLAWTRRTKKRKRKKTRASSGTSSTRQPQTESNSNNDSNSNSKNNLLPSL